VIFSYIMFILFYVHWLFKTLFTNTFTSVMQNTKWLNFVNCCLIFVSLVWNLLHDIFLACRILMCLLDIWNLCTPIFNICSSLNARHQVSYSYKRTVYLVMVVWRIFCLQCMALTRKRKRHLGHYVCICFLSLFHLQIQIYKLVLDRLELVLDRLYVQVSFVFVAVTVKTWLNFLASG
jgi:hypothetical protein